ncbi:MAG: low temperature requirement protein A [Methanobrevibacter sp.]|jgi:low temperature requirement protein LtrA|nr:low temperature requirement protein A [Methanobrevibacter sp.]
MKFRKDFIITPVLNDEISEKHANWLELLFDLIFVAAVSQVALNLSEDYSLINFLTLIPLFFAIWWAWTGQTYFLDRFGTDDILSRIIIMAQILIVAAMVLNVSHASTTTGIGFIISYVLLRLILVLEYRGVGRELPESKPITDRYSIGFFIAACIWLFSIAVPYPYNFIVWIFALIADLLTPIAAGELHIKFPPHPAHLPERFGLFIIIVIGEAIVSIVDTMAEMHLTLLTSCIGIIGLILSFTLWWGYFEEANGAEKRVREKGKVIAKYQLWIYSHFPLMLGILGVAVGIKQIIHSPTAPINSWLLCISLVVSLISLNLIFISSINWKNCIDRIILNYRTPHYFIIILVFLTGFLGFFINSYIILFIITLLSVINAIISLREPPERICKL